MLLPVDRTLIWRIGMRPLITQPSEYNPELYKSMCFHLLPPCQRLTTVSREQLYHTDR